MKKISLMKSKMFATYVKKDYKKYQKVRGHCHYTGKFRGTAHGICKKKFP